MEIHTPPVRLTIVIPQRDYDFQVDQLVGGGGGGTQLFQVEVCGLDFRSVGLCELIFASEREVL